MPRIATTDTFATETVYGNEVRRFVKAGDVVPDLWEVDASDVEDVADVSPREPGVGTEVQEARHRRAKAKKSEDK
jgi:hypothetical protein